MQHSEISSTPNASNCTNQSDRTSITNNTSVHGVHHNSTTISTHANTSNVASPSDVSSTKRKYDAVNTVTPASSSKRPTRVQNVYGTGPPRGTMPKVSILRNGTSTNPVSNKQGTTLPSSVRALQFADSEKEKEKQFDAFYPKQGTYEADLMKEILNAHQKTDEYLIWDPRGWELPGMFGDDSTVDTMPKTFCPHCRCPPDKCHVKTFGRHCQLHVVYALYDQDFDLMMTEAHAEELYTEKYNDALSFKITEETGQLDVKLNGYPLPKCMRRDSLTESLDYVRWYTYHCKMHRAIVVGRGNPQQGQNKIFELQK
jgi:hypothetical protein